MKRNVSIILLFLGIGCFVYDFFWLNPEITSLLAQYKYLISFGLHEESGPYINEAMTLSKWVVPIAVLGLFLIAPFSSSLFIKYSHRHDQK
jgi:hypothetical protein